MGYRMDLVTLAVSAFVCAVAALCGQLPNIST